MSSIHRRDFLKTSAAVGAGFWLGLDDAPVRAAGPNEKLNIAMIGLGGQGSGHVDACGKSQNIVALCDVDDVRGGKAYEKFPQAKKFYDFRKMFDELESKIDAVVVSTPDHTHFHPTHAALQRGKHVYLEKPMAHNVWEAREITKLAAEKKLATQLGVQRHANEALRRGVQLVQSGVIGPIKEVHSWVGSSRGMMELKPESPIPETLKYDLWQGPIAERPYNPAITPYGWRFWWAYGTGEAGNWGCHVLDIPFWALGLKYPTKVSGSGPKPDPEKTPKTMATRFEFPAIGSRPAVVLNWYQGQPSIIKELGLEPKGANNLFIGEKGMILCGFDKPPQLLPAEQFKDHKAEALPKIKGFRDEWFEACKGGPAASCNFDYSGPMSETVLLANVAYRVQGSFDWDHEQLKTVGNDAAQKLIREEYRKGWEIK